MFFFFLIGFISQKLSHRFVLIFLFLKSLKAAKNLSACSVFISWKAHLTQLRLLFYFKLKTEQINNDCFASLLLEREGWLLIRVIIIILLNILTKVFLWPVADIFEDQNGEKLSRKLSRKSGLAEKSVDTGHQTNKSMINMKSAKKVNIWPSSWKIWSKMSCVFY